MANPATEVWRQIDGTTYYVSDKCRVRNAKGRVLKPSETYTGYLYVTLKTGKAQRHAYVHRLAAIAFIPNPDNRPVVDHINRKPYDNRLPNLRWATFKENRQNSEGYRGTHTRKINQLAP